MERMRAKLRALWMRMTGVPNHEGEFDDELANHVALHTEDGIRAGLSEEEARRRALIRLGGAEQVRQAYRERRGFPALESLGRDLRYSLRTLAKHPAITAI